jgi:hypothetical protein
MAEKKSTPIKDVDKILRYLTNMFNNITFSLPRAARTKTGPNQLYKLQSEFAYLLNEVALGQPAVMQKHIAACNDFIDKTMQDLTPKD